MMPLKYLTLSDAIETHRLTIQVSGGGHLGQLQIQTLGSVLDHIQNDIYYPQIIDKLTHLFFCVNKFHCFADGNKRLAISLCAQFLLINGYVFVSSFCAHMENISYHVASGLIDKDLLRELFDAVLNEELDEREDLKLRLVNAISQGGCGGPPQS